MGALSQADEAQLKAQLRDAVAACTERCLYHSAKWCVLPAMLLLDCQWQGAC
jgi:anaphase-promoting complex subunit 8